MSNSLKIRDTVMNDTPLCDHFEAYEHSRNEYVTQILSVFGNAQLSKNVTLKNKGRMLVVLLHRFDKDGFAKIINKLDLPEVVRACEVLDSARLIRQMTKTLENAGKQKATKLKPKLKLATEMNESQSDLSLTSSRIKIIKTWVRQLTPEQLVYRALMYPADGWRKLADLTHLNSEKDFALDWFLPWCFGKELPESNIVRKVKNLTLDNFISVYNEYHLPYEIARLKLKEFGAGNVWNTSVQPQLRQIYAHIATIERMETLLWYWDELHSTTVDQVLAEQLKRYQNVNLSYGKLADLLMKVESDNLRNELIRIAENKLKEYNLSLPKPIVVLGDASSSMQVAVNTSSIITSLLCSLAKAELHLFRQGDEPIDNPPTDVESAVAFAKRMRASGSTSPASSLAYYYDRKQVVKTFVVVTDEEENTSSKGKSQWGASSMFGGKPAESDGLMFAPLYKKYCQEVYSAKLVFISFTDPNTDGQMVKDLKNIMGESAFSEFVQVFKFNVRNPDLNRLDYALEQMTTATSVGDSTSSCDVKVVKIE